MCSLEGTHVDLVNNHNTLEMRTSDDYSLDVRDKFTEQNIEDDLLDFPDLVNFDYLESPVNNVERRFQDAFDSVVEYMVKHPVRLNTDNDKRYPVLDVRQQMLQENNYRLTNQASTSKKQIDASKSLRSLRRRNSVRCQRENNVTNVDAKLRESLRCIQENRTLIYDGPDVEESKEAIGLKREGAKLRLIEILESIKYMWTGKLPITLGVPKQHRWDDVCFMNNRYLDNT